MQRLFKPFLYKNLKVLAPEVTLNIATSLHILSISLAGNIK